MGWSDWIQSPTKQFFPGHRRHIQYSTHDSYFTAFDLTLGMADTITGQGIFGPPGLIHEATQYDVPTIWDELAPIPPEFGGLTFGVDYTIKPGASMSDPYRYVDYDPDDHAEVLGWDLPAPVVLPRDFFDQSATLWLDAHTTYPTGVTSGSLPIGTAFTAISLTDPAGTVLTPPPDPGNTLSFTVGISPDFVAPDDTRDPLVGVQLSGPDFEGWPIVNVRPQRWRYWKPGILPLRQYPRNDGLRGGAPSARPTSRQGTTARRTYL